jgi:pseudoazurin
MLKVGYWTSLDYRKVLTRILPLLFLPAMALAAEHEVQSVSHRNYESMFFDPHYLEVEPGESVAFVVTDSDHQPQSVFIPAGADHWKAEKGKSTTVNFDHEGLYIYDCAYHNLMGMAGVILVGNPVNLEDARLFYEQYKKQTFAMNKDRLDPVWDLINQSQIDQARAE